MARRRLLTILAASAVLGAAVAGPAAAVDLVGASQEPVAEVAEEPVQVAEQAVEDVADTLVDEPVAAVTHAVEETVAPEPSPSPSPSPSPDEEPTAPAASSTNESGDALVAASGDVTAAPSLAFLTGTGGSAPAPQSRLDVPPPSPDVTSEPASSEAVPAPQVAPAPAAVADAPAPSMLAQAVDRAVDDEGMPIIVVVAIVSLLAAGLGTVQGARSATA